MFAQIIFPVCQYCASYGEGSWEWWIKGCWKWTCDPIGGTVLMGLTVAGYVGVQLWASHKQPKA